MKIKHLVLSPIFLAVFVTGNANAQSLLFGTEYFHPSLRNKLVTTNILAPQERQELEKLRQQKAIDERVQIEFDRAFNRPINFILLWLIVLTLLPITTAIWVWFLRRSVITQIVSELKGELPKEIPSKVEANATDEITEKINIFNREIEARLQQLQMLEREIRQERENFFQELSAVNYSYYPENVVSENQMPIEQEGENTELNKQATETGNETSAYIIESAETQLDPNTEELTAIDYFNQGNQHLNEGRYAEANVSFNQAVQLDRDFSEARYQNAKAYAMRGSVNPAIGNLQWAIDIDISYKERANNDSAFDPIREDENFKKLIES